MQNIDAEKYDLLLLQEKLRKNEIKGNLNIF